jgi:hypothetical protein
MDEKKRDGMKCTPHLEKEKKEHLRRLKLPVVRHQKVLRPSGRRY